MIRRMLAQVFDVASLLTAVRLCTSASAAQSWAVHEVTAEVV
jgi:hypothetical protein